MESIVGIHAVRQALIAGEGRSLMVRPGKLNPRLQEVVDLAKQQGVEVSVGEVRHEELADQGVWDKPEYAQKLGKERSTLEGVVLNVDLVAHHSPLVCIHPYAINLVNYHANKAHELTALDLLGVQIVRFAHVKVRNDIFDGLLEQHVFVQLDIMVELLVGLSLEVVDHGDLGRVVLDHELSGHGGHKRPAQRQFVQIHKPCIWFNVHCLKLLHCLTTR